MPKTHWYSKKRRRGCSKKIQAITTVEERMKKFLNPRKIAKAVARDMRAFEKCKETEQLGEEVRRFRFKCVEGQAKYFALFLLGVAAAASWMKIKGPQGTAPAALLALSFAAVTGGAMRETRLLRARGFGSDYSLEFAKERLGFVDECANAGYLTSFLILLLVFTSLPALLLLPLYLLAMLATSFEAVHAACALAGMACAAIWNVCLSKSLLSESKETDE